MRQENFKEISGFPVIPAEAGEILYHDTVYFAGLDILYHLKKSRSLKIHAGPSTVNILRRQYQIRMVGGVISQYSQLRLDTVFFLGGTDYHRGTDGHRWQYGLLWQSFPALYL